MFACNSLSNKILSKSKPSILIMSSKNNNMYDF